MDLNKEKQRIASIVEIVSRGVSCGDDFPPSEWADEFEGGVGRMLVVLGLTKADAPVDSAYIYEFCSWFPDPRILFAGLYFQSGECDSGANFECVNGCELAPYCPSKYDPDNRPEECGE